MADSPDGPTEKLLHLWIHSRWLEYLFRVAFVWIGLRKTRVRHDYSSFPSFLITVRISSMNPAMMPTINPAK